MRKLIILTLILATVACSESTTNNAPPKIELTSVAPTAGGADRLITLKTNHGFSSVTGGNTVTFNGVKGRILFESPDEIRVLVPKGAGTGKISIDASGTTIEGPVFTYLEAPTTTYFVRYKENGVSINLESSKQPDGSGCSGCMCYSIQQANVDRSFSMRICSPPGTTPADVEAMTGKVFPVRDSRTESGALIISNLNGGYYASNSTGALGETVTFTKVAYHSSTNGMDSFDVSGTFAVLLTNPDNKKTLSLTEGTFLAIYTVRTDL